MITNVLLQLLFLSAAAIAASNKPRFQVYWNIPDRCSKALNQADYFSFLDQYGIIRNTNGQIYGGNVTLMYSKHFKSYPHLVINGTSRKVIREVDGGIPQRTNFTAFFKSAEEAIEKLIPDPAFDGPAILDFEEFRFKYKYNWYTKIAYKKTSDAYTAQKYPNISSKAVKIRSETEFNEAARKIAMGVLRLGKRMRPNAQWGFYLMPECSGHFELTLSQCTGLYGYNEEMAELFSEQTALFPSIYYDKETPVLPNYRSTQIRLREARRFSLSPKGRIPIYAYIKIEYDAYNQPLWYYSKADLCSTFQGAFEEGVQGLIIWGADRQPWKDRCPGMKHYVENVFGPVVMNMQKKVEKCSQRVCSGQGVCLRPGDLRLDCKWNLKGKLKSMVCLCDKGYYGVNCELRKKQQKKDPNKLMKKYRTTVLPVTTTVLTETTTATTTPLTVTMASVEAFDLMPVSPPSTLPVMEDFDLMSISPSPLIPYN